MGQIIAIVNQKGGVGKTTTAINLAAYLAYLGKKTLLVDLDPQGNASTGVGVNIHQLSHGLYEVLAGQHPIHQVVKPTNVDGLHVVPSTSNLSGANIELVNIERREWQLLNHLNDLKDVYDFIIIDCPPSLGLLTVNGLVAADELLIPVQCEYYALEGLGQLLHTISLVQNHLKNELGILGAVMTMYDRRNRLAESIFNELYHYFPNKIFRSVIPRHAKLAEAPSHGKTILEYDPRGRGAKAYHKLALEILDYKRN